MASPIYRFAEFRLDPAGYELWRGDEELALPPKAFGCLVYLVKNRDRAVERDELIEAVWGKENLAESVLGRAIFDVRRALDDNGEEPRYIKTVRGVGYRWAAPVEAGMAPVETLPGRRPNALPRRLLVGILAAGVLAAGTAYVWQVTHPGDAGRPTVQVAEGDVTLLLPVTVKASDRHPWIRLGVMDLIAARLRAAGQPMVPSDTVIALLRDHTVEPDPEEIEGLAATSGARLVLGASAEVAGENWRVSLRSLHGPQPALTAIGEAEDVLDAARSAADRMALSLGLKPPPAPDAHPGLALLLQQVEAAVLAQQMEVARELIETADAELRQDPKARLWLARIDLASGNLDAAQESFESLSEEPTFERDPVLRARVLYGLSGVYSGRGDYETAKPILEEAVRVLGQASQGEAVAVRGRIQTVLGAVAALNHDVEAAQEHLARARVALESTADVSGLPVLENNLGVLEVLRENYPAALHYFERSADARPAVHDLGGELRARANMIEVHLVLLEPQAALELEPRVNELLGQTTNPGMLAHGNLARAALLAANGQSQAARDVLAGALRALAAHGVAELQPWALVLHAEQLAQEDDLARAARVAARVVKQVPPDSLLFDDYLGRAWLVMLRARLSERDLGTAARISAAMNDWAERSPAQAPKTYAALAGAELAAARGLGDAAERGFQRALALAESVEIPLLSLQVAEGYVPWLLGDGPHGTADPERALLVADRLARYADQEYRASLLQLRVHHAMGLPSAWRHALTRTQSLADERQIPRELLSPPQIQ